MNNVKPIKIDINIITQVSRLNKRLNCILVQMIGIKNQNLEDPHKTEKGSKPKRGINVFGLFSEKLLVFQFDGDIKIL